MKTSLPFERVVHDCSAGNGKIPKSEYLPYGPYPVVDQGQDLIGGYTTNASALFRGILPVIVFGDHTRIFKYIDFDFCIGADGTKVLSAGSNADPKFIYHYLKSLTIPNAGYSRHFKFLKRLELHLPPLSEQRRIAAILDKAEAIRAKRQEAVQKLELLRKAILIDMFGDPSANDRLWPTARLMDTCSLIADCPHSTPHWTATGVVCLRTSNLTIGGWDWQDKRFVTEDEHVVRTRRAPLEPGDVILSREGTVGIAAIVPEGLKASMGQRLVQVRVDSSSLEPEYLLMFLLHALSPARIAATMVGSTSKHLNVADLRRLVIPLPPLESQRVFAKRSLLARRLLSRMDNHIEIITHLMASLNHEFFIA
jgi:type I restriction enzyme S subunit